jgi:hypothetical protein
MKRLGRESQAAKSRLRKSNLPAGARDFPKDYAGSLLCRRRIALARKGHFRVLGKGLGIGQKEVEIGVGPVTAFGFEGLGIFEALDRALCAANHTEERGT